MENHHHHHNHHVTIMENHHHHHNHHVTIMENHHHHHHHHVTIMENHHHHHNHHVTIMEMGHFLTCSGLTHPVVCSVVSSDFFCLLVCNFLLSLVTSYRHSICKWNPICSVVPLPKLGSYLIPLQYTVLLIYRMEYVLRVIVEFITWQVLWNISDVNVLKPTTSFMYQQL